MCVISVEPMAELSRDDEDELSSHLFSSEASRVMAAVLARCIRYTERCDEQMTARMQRKNRQVCFLFLLVLFFGLFSVGVGFGCVLACFLFGFCLVSCRFVHFCCAICDVSLRFVSFRVVSFRFESIQVVSFRSVPFRLKSFQVVSFRASLGGLLGRPCLDD